jgi:PhnB protein
MDMDLQEPEGGLTAHLAIGGGRAAEAVEFYKKAFGAEELMRHPSDDGRLMHVHLKVNGSSLMMHDHFAEHHGGTDLAEPSGVMLHLQVNDADCVVEPRYRGRWKCGDGTGRSVLGRPLWPA